MGDEDESHQREDHLRGSKRRLRGRRGGVRPRPKIGGRGDPVVLAAADDDEENESADDQQRGDEHHDAVQHHQNLVRLLELAPRVAQPEALLGPEEVDDVGVADDGQDGDTDQDHFGPKHRAQGHLLQGPVDADELLHHHRHRVPHGQEEAHVVGEHPELAHSHLGHDGQVVDVGETVEEIGEEKAAVRHRYARQVGHGGNLPEPGPREDQVGQQVAQHAHDEDDGVAVVLHRCHCCHEAVSARWRTQATSGRAREPVGGVRHMVMRAVKVRC